MVFNAEKKQLAIVSIFPNTSCILPTPFLFVHMSADSSHTVCLILKLLSQLSGRLLTVRSVTSLYNGVWSPMFTGAGQGTRFIPIEEVPIGFRAFFSHNYTFSLHLDMV